MSKIEIVVGVDAVFGTNQTGAVRAYLLLSFCIRVEIQHSVALEELVTVDTLTMDYNQLVDDFNELRQKKIQLKSKYAALRQEHTKLGDKLVHKDAVHKDCRKKSKNYAASRPQTPTDKTLRSRTFEGGSLLLAARNTADVHSANNQYNELKRSYDELHNGNDSLWKGVEASEAQRDKARKRQHELVAQCEEQDARTRRRDRGFARCDLRAEAGYVADRHLPLNR